MAWTLPYNQWGTNSVLQTSVPLEVGHWSFIQISGFPPLWGDVRTTEVCCCSDILSRELAAKMVPGGNLPDAANSGLQQSSHWGHVLPGLTSARTEHSRDSRAMPFLFNMRLLLREIFALGLPVCLAETFSDLPCSQGFSCLSSFLTFLLLPACSEGNSHLPLLLLHKHFPNKSLAHLIPSWCPLLEDSNLYSWYIEWSLGTSLFTT